MLINYLKTAVRNLVRFRIYSAINIVGLAVGTAACLLIFMYVRNDLSFDKFNRNYSRIYRVDQVFTQNGKVEPWSLTPTGYANAFPNEFPGVKTVRLKQGLGNIVVTYNGRMFTLDDFCLADSSFFDVFTFPLIEGNPKTALSEPFSAVITQEEARKIFGSEDPMGKLVRVDNLFDFKIAGVAKDPPHNSSIQFSLLASFISLKDIFHSRSSELLNDFGSSDYYTFLLLPGGMRIEEIRNNLHSLLLKYRGADLSKGERLVIQPFSDIHFDRTYLFDFPNKGDIQYDYILSGIALFILLIACINFINISTARSSTRAREIGIRKVLGSSRAGLIRQFIFEFAMLALLSLVLALVLAELFLPGFNSLANSHLSVRLLSDPETILTFAAIWILVVFSACAYPSFYLSSFVPALTMKGGKTSGGRAGITRKSLIVFQFSISVFLIVATIVMWSQYRFLKAHKLGFNAHEVVFLPLNTEVNSSYDAFKSQLLQGPGVITVTRSNWIPGHPQDIESYYWTGKTGRQSGSFYTSIVDPDYAIALGLKFAAGRNFSWNMPTDWKESIILNETAARMMGWTPEEAIGKSVTTYYHPKGHVIGVIRDFNFQSLQQGIQPVAMMIDSSVNYYHTLALKLSSRDIPGTIAYLRSTWKMFSPDLPFDYKFLDQSFEGLYLSEQRLSRVFGAFSLLSVVIACLGLFGLSSYSAQARMKEMGIRKVVGASASQIVGLAVGDFVKFVAIANVIAWPLAYYAMQRWLRNFAYRIDMAPWIFLLAGGLALAIAMATVSVHAIKAAAANPVDALHYE